MLTFWLVLLDTPTSQLYGRLAVDQMSKSQIFPQRGGKQFWLVLAVLASSGEFCLVLLNRSSRGDKILFKNIKIFKIHKKFTELGRFEIRISHETIDLLDFHWYPFTNTKGNQWKSSKSMVSWEILISNQPNSVNFLWIFMFF